MRSNEISMRHSTVKASVSLKPIRKKIRRLHCYLSNLSKRSRFLWRKNIKTLNRLWHCSREPRMIRIIFIAFAVFSIPAESSEPVPSPLKEVFCTFKVHYSVFLQEMVCTCLFNQTIDSDAYVLGSTFNTSIEQVFVNRISKVKDLPRQIGEKFPNLKEFSATRCQLTIVRNYYFRNMENLKFLNLRQNKITTIESDAFKDLVSVYWMNLLINMIETFDDKLFATMVNLESLHMNFNKIKILSPKAFSIPGGKLQIVDLSWNVCVNKNYTVPDNWNQLESDLKANCTGWIV